MERNIFTTVAIAIMCLFLASCNSVGNMNRTQNVSADSDAVEGNETGYGIDEWEKDPTLGRVQPGIYKRIGIVKKDESYEEMLKLRDIENKPLVIQERVSRVNRSKELTNTHYYI